MGLSSRLTCLNLAVCEEFGSPFEVSRAHHLVTLDKQSDQLHGLSKSEQTAHTAFMISKLQPFQSGNTRTAVALVATEHTIDKERLVQIAGLLKHGASVSRLAQEIEGTA